MGLCLSVWPQQLFRPSWRKKRNERGWSREQLKIKTGTEKEREKQEQQEQDSTGISRELPLHSEGKKKEFREILEGKDGKEIKAKRVETIKMWFQSVPRLERLRMPLDVTQNVFLHS